MSYRLEFHEKVTIDYEEAYEWYEKKTQGLGDRFLSTVRKTLELIAKNPENFGQREMKGHREASVAMFPYVIVYKIYKRDKSVFINSIHHTSKNPQNKFRMRE